MRSECTIVLRSGQIILGKIDRIEIDVGVAQFQIDGDDLAVIDLGINYRRGLAFAIGWVLGTIVMVVILIVKAYL